MGGGSGAQRGAGDSGSGAKSSRYRGGKAASGAAGRRRRKVCSCSTCWEHSARRRPSGIPEADARSALVPYLLKQRCFLRRALSDSQRDNSAAAAAVLQGRERIAALQRRIAERRAAWQVGTAVPGDTNALRAENAARGLQGRAGIPGSVSTGVAVGQGGDRPSLLPPGEAPCAALRPGPGPPAQQRGGAVGRGPEEGTEVSRGLSTSVQRQAEGAGLVRPGEEKAAG